MSSAGFPESAIACAIPAASEHSQPSERTRTAPDVRVLRDPDHFALRPGVGQAITPAGDNRIIQLPGNAARDLFRANDREEHEQAIADANLSIRALVTFDGNHAEIIRRVASDGHRTTSCGYEPALIRGAANGGSLFRSMWSFMGEEAGA
jgi:hypothetical protein